MSAEDARGTKRRREDSDSTLSDEQRSVIFDLAFNHPEEIEKILNISHKIDKIVAIASKEQTGWGFSSAIPFDFVNKSQVRAIIIRKVLADPSAEVDVIGKAVGSAIQRFFSQNFERLLRSQEIIDIIEQKINEF